jgi:hypothetical protein
VGSLTYRTRRTLSLAVFFSRQWPWLRFQVWRDSKTEASSGLVKAGISIRFSRWVPTTEMLLSTNADASIEDNLIREIGEVVSGLGGPSAAPANAPGEEQGSDHSERAGGGPPP